LITARFVADFSSFQDAVLKADITLKNLEADANKVSASLNRMVETFSGRKMIQDALLMTQAVKDVGGASALTATEMARVNATLNEAIAKYTALGKVAPQSMLDLAKATKAAETNSVALVTATKTAETASVSWATSLGQVNRLLGALGIGLSVGAVVSFGKEFFRIGD
jgi:hypothetical protein